LAVLSTARRAESTRAVPLDLGDEDLPDELRGFVRDLDLGELRDLLVFDEERDLLDEPPVLACDFRAPWELLLERRVLAWAILLSSFIEDSHPIPQIARTNRRRSNGTHSTFAVQLTLPLSGALLVELGLDLGALGALLGDRGLGAALLGTLPVVPRIVVLGLGLHLPELPIVGFLAGGRDDEREQDQDADDNGDDRKRGHLSSLSG
jgi:hypothetical protein